MRLPSRFYLFFDVCFTLLEISLHARITIRPFFCLIYSVFLPYQSRGVLSVEKFNFIGVREEFDWFDNASIFYYTPFRFHWPSFIISFLFCSWFLLYVVAGLPPGSTRWVGIWSIGKWWFKISRSGWWYWDYDGYPFFAFRVMILIGDVLDYRDITTNKIQKDYFIIIRKWW